MTSTPPTAERDAPEPPFAAAKVEEMLRQLDKTVRARQLYMANNPTYQRALDALRATFQPLWAEASAIELTVTETQFCWYGVPVHQQPAKATDSLPWLCYKDGLRGVTLLRGFEAEELETFIELIPRVRRAAADEDDLVTLLWEQEFDHLSYRHVEIGQDAVAAIEAGHSLERHPDGGRAASARAAIEDARGSASAADPGSPTPAIVSIEDFDSTLYFLDDAEIEFVRRELETEYARDLRRSVLDALLDMFELHADPAMRAEIIEQLGQLVLHLLSAARFDTVAYLLREVRIVVGRARALDDQSRQQLEQLPQRLSHPYTLSNVLQQLEDATSVPGIEDLAALFTELDAGALETIVRFLPTVRDEHVRAVLETAVSRLGSTNTQELVRLISVLDGPAAVEVIDRVGALQTPAAVTPLTTLLGHPDRTLRLAAVQALVTIGSPGALHALDRALADVDRDVRVTAVRALGAKGQRASLARIEAIIRGRELRAADLTERVAFFEAYGALCGESGVALLDGLLNGRSGLLGRREALETRACAALALGRIESRAAQQALQRAATAKDVVVRNAVNRALRGSE